MGSTGVDALDSLNRVAHQMRGNCPASPVCPPSARVCRACGRLWCLGLWSGSVGGFFVVCPCLSGPGLVPGSLVVLGCFCPSLWPLVFWGRQPENCLHGLRPRTSVTGTTRDGCRPQHLDDWLVLCFHEFSTLPRFPSSDGSCVRPPKSALVTDLSRRRMCESGFRPFPRARLHQFPVLEFYAAEALQRHV